MVIKPSTSSSSEEAYYTSSASSLRTKAKEEEGYSYPPFPNMDNPKVKGKQEDQSRVQCICEICTCGNHSCRHNNFRTGHVKQPQSHSQSGEGYLSQSRGSSTESCEQFMSHSQNQERTEISSGYHQNEYKKTEDEQTKRVRVDDGNLITTFANEGDKIFLRDLYNQDQMTSSQTQMNQNEFSSSATAMYSSSMQEANSAASTSMMTSSREQNFQNNLGGNIEIRDISDDNYHLNNSNEMTGEVHGTASSYKMNSSSHETQSSFGPGSKRLMRGATVTKKILRGGKWETVEEMEDSSSVVESLPNQYPQTSDSGNISDYETKRLQESSDESSRSVRSIRNSSASSNGAAVIEIDRKTGRRVLRAPPTKQRVLKGGKWEIVTVPGEIISDDSSFNRSSDTLATTATLTSDSSVDSSSFNESSVDRRRHQFRGTQLETMASGTTHDYGDVQGLTVVTHSKSSMAQTEDQLKAQAALQKLSTDSRVYGVDYEKSLRGKGAEVLGVHEREISRGVVRISDTGVETTEDVEKSIREIKAAPVNSQIQIAETIESTTRSSDKQTFKFEELTEDRIQIMEKRAEERRKAGQAMVEDSYDVKTSFETKDRNGVKSVAVADENFTSTTYLEKHEANDMQMQSGEIRYVVYPRVQPVRHEDNLKIEGKFYGRQVSSSSITPSERRLPIKFTDNLRQEGEFLGERQQMPEWKPERVQPIRQTDSLRPEGMFLGERVKMPEVKPEKNMPIKHEDNLRPGGDFTDKPRTMEWVKGERADKIVMEDNLRMEGSFHESTTNKEEFQKFVRGDRHDVKKHEDHLHMTGEFYDETVNKGMFKPSATAPERSLPIKQVDSLKPEGDFYGEKNRMPVPMQDTIANNKSQLIIQKDNLRMEGKFYRPTKEENVPVPQSERAKPVKHLDNLHMEGTFYGEKDKMPEIIKPEKSQPIKYSDNLKPGGEFYDKEKVPAPIRPERTVPVKFKDNLSSEGDFLGERKVMPQPEANPDRSLPIRQNDNLKPGGEFYDKPKSTGWTPGERVNTIVKEDNLKMQGEFYEETTNKEEFQKIVKGDRFEMKRREDQLQLKMSEDFHDTTVNKEMFQSPKSDRVDAIRPIDNLKVEEGEFTERQKETVFVRGERAEKVVHKDTLKMEGEFYKPEKDAYVPGERSQPIKQPDSLKVEGEFLGQREKMPEVKPEKNLPIKQKDNLTPGGEFYDRPQQKAPLRGERYDTKIPEDNLKPEGKFYRKPREENAIPVERVKPVKHSDNLRSEGEFYGKRERMLETRPEKSQPIRQEDNLRMEGDFHGERKKMPDVKSIEKSQPIKQTDTLKPEGQFYGEKDAMPEYNKPERSMPIKYDDQLKLEGQFYDKPKITEWVRGERADKVVHEDNLHLEGTFNDATVNREMYRSFRGERADVKRPVDNLKQEGEFMEKQKNVTYLRGERAEKVVHKDTLKMEGDFEGTTMAHDEFRHYTKGDRADVVRREDHLKMEGEFYRPEKKNVQTPVERTQPIKHNDQLKPEGKFLGEREKMPEYHAERNLPIKYKDELVTEGPFYGEKDKMPVYKPEKSQPIRQTDNLRPEGKFLGEREKMPDQKPEKNLPIKQKDNLKSEGEFHDKPRQTVWVKGERADKVVHKDTLKMEGEFNGTSLAQEQFPAFTRGERADIVRREDHLKMEGELSLETSSRDDFQGGIFQQDARLPPIRPKDNLSVASREVAFAIGKSTTPRPSQLPIWRGDRYEMKRHQTTLKLEGDHYFSNARKFSPSPQPQPKSLPIRPHDNLQLQGELNFDSIESSPFKRCPTPLVGERASIRRHQDNLRLDGEFYGFSKRSPSPFPELGLSPRHLQRQAKERRSLRFPSGRKNISQIMLGDNLNSNTAGDLFRTTYASSQAYRVSRSHGGTPSGHYHGQDGSFATRTEESVVRGERFEAKKPQDNLKLTGPIQVPEKAPVHVKGERAPVVRHSDNLSVGEGSMSLDTTTRSQQRAVVIEIDRSSDNIRSRRQSGTQSQIVLGAGEDIGNAKFDKTTQAKRTTVEQRTLDNGHMVIDKSIETVNRQGAETKQSVDKSVEQKIITQAMGAKSHVNQTMILNNLNQSLGQSHQQNQFTSSSTSATSATEKRGSLSSSSSQTQVFANKQGAREVQVVREVTVTKKNEAGTGGEAVMTTSSETHAMTSTSPKILNTTTQAQAQSQSRFNSEQNGMSSSSHQRMMTSASSRESRSMTSHSHHHQRSVSSNGVFNRGHGYSNGDSRHETIASTLRAGTPDSAQRRIDISQTSDNRRFTSSSSSYGSHCALHQSAAQQAEIRFLPGRTQKIQRADNLTVGGGAFDSLTSSRSSFRRHKIDPQDRVVPLRAAHQSNISFASYGTSESFGTSYRNEFVQQQQVVKPCPAAHIQSSRSPFQLQRQTSSHQFYAVKASD